MRDGNTCTTYNKTHVMESMSDMKDYAIFSTKILLKNYILFNNGRKNFVGITYCFILLIYINVFLSV